MLHNTRGIVLRSVKYGDSSLITTLFTQEYGVQSYMVQGVRSSSAKNNKAALLQPATLLDLVVYHKPQTNLQRIKEFQYAHIYTTMQEEVVKNSIALFSVELLLRLLPEHAKMPELFNFAFGYFQQLDTLPVKAAANFPLYFIIQCSKLLGYEIHGTYTAQTSHLNLQEGAFTAQLSQSGKYVSDAEAQVLSELLKTEEANKLNAISMNAETRNRLLDWYIEFLHQHTQHLGSIRSLEVLRAILH